MNEIITQGEFNIEKLTKDYLDYIDVSAKTIDTYNIAIRQFITYLKENGITAPQRADVIKWRDMLKENHSVATVNSYLIAVRNLFKYLQYVGVYKNITENIKGLKDTILHKREAISVEYCKELFATAKNDKEKVIFVLAVCCGLRANEIVNIKLEDFKKEEGQIRLYVLGKGRDYKQDYVIIPNSILEIIKNYIEEYKISDYLIVSSSNHNKGRQVDTSAIRRIVNGMYQRIGIKSKKIVLHSLRHSFATISLQNGQDIREVSKAMRHSSVAVTERYAHDLEMKNNKCSAVVCENIFG